MARLKKKPAGRHSAAQGGPAPATMAEDRSWMYTGRPNKKTFTPEWVEKTNEFVEHAFRILPPEPRAWGVPCPCARCCNRLSRSKYDMQLHLAKNGFMPDYTVWMQHREDLRPQPAKPSDDHAGGGEQVRKPQETKKWEMSVLEAYARGKLRKADQMEWSYQKYQWEQEKARRQQQRSAPKAKRLLTFAEEEGNNVSVPDPELEDTVMTAADGHVANPAMTSNACGVQIPAGPTVRPKRKAGPPGWHSGPDWAH